MPCSRPLRERFESVRVHPPLPLVEVGSGGSQSDQPQVHVHAVEPHDVAKESIEVVDAISRRLEEKTHARTFRQQPLGCIRRFSGVALQAEELLW